MKTNQEISSVIIESTPPIHHIPFLDSLKGFAILAVVLSHTSAISAPDSLALKIFAGTGARGVQLFFFISAFSLFLSFSRRNTSDTHFLTHYFIRRFFRIAPLFYVMILVYMLIYGTAPRFWAPDGLSWHHIASTFTFVNAWYPSAINSVIPGGWAVAIEMNFYLLVPFLFAHIKSIERAIVSILAFLLIHIILSPAMYHLLSGLYDTSHKRIIGPFTSLLWLPAELPVFGLGILFFFIFKEIKNRNRERAGVFFLLFLVLTVSAISTKTPFNMFPRHFFHSIAFLFLAISLTYYPSKVLVNRFTSYIGKISYSIYLSHFAVLHFIKPFLNTKVTGNMGFAISFLALILPTLAISMVTYRFIERPMNAYGRYFCGRNIDQRKNMPK